MDLLRHALSVTLPFKKRVAQVFLFFRYQSVLGEEPLRVNCKNILRRFPEQSAGGPVVWPLFMVLRGVSGVRGDGAILLMVL